MTYAETVEHLHAAMTRDFRLTIALIGLVFLGLVLIIMVGRNR